CTRRWISCPVESREDWEEMKERYDPDHPDRLPDNLGEIGTELKDRSWPLEAKFPGPFWQVREWMGFETLCRCLYDDPELVSDMMDFWREFVSRLMEKLFRHVVPDVIHISEDMAYKGKSMLSPSMVRDLLMPAWEEWGDLARDAGVRVYAIDSDGYIGELIPLWIEAGMNACDPVEAAAGNDIREYRKEFGGDMAFGGGVDKRAMARGGEDLDEELERLRPVIEDGGYIPSCDHGVPSDVSWPNYVRYVKRLADVTGWL
ncbi:MAG: uroporphyrinogen decarboxylase family protein, partial [Planctomycetota bacterium]